MSKPNSASSSATTLNATAQIARPWRSFSRLLGGGLFLVTAALAFALPGFEHASPLPLNHPMPPAPLGGQSTLPGQVPEVEVVFVLDTTSSMSGLIESAKEKIWSLASAMAQAQPAPRIKIGLVAYRDRGDAYVTQVHDLSLDLDAIYAQLMEFRAEGGGDGPESVNQALHEALEQIHWSTNPRVYKSVFLVGDAPPHMDYPNDVPYTTSLNQALQRGIVVNTIQCGDWAQTRQQWQSIAQNGGGRYFQVEQGGGALAAVSSPFDDELTRVAKSLEETRLYREDEASKDEVAQARAVEEKLYASAPPSALAARASFSAGSSGRANLLGNNELVDAVSRGEVALAEVAETELPPLLQAVAPERRAAKVAEIASQRVILGEKLEALSRQRSAYLAAQVSEADAAVPAWDVQVLAAVREQAATKGLRYSEEVTPAATASVADDTTPVDTPDEVN